MGCVDVADRNRRGAAPIDSQSLQGYWSIMRSVARYVCAVQPSKHDKYSSSFSMSTPLTPVCYLNILLRSELPHSLQSTSELRPRSPRPPPPSTLMRGGDRCPRPHVSCRREACARTHTRRCISTNTRTHSHAHADVHAHKAHANPRTLALSHADAQSRGDLRVVLDSADYGDKRSVPFFFSSVHHHRSRVDEFIRTEFHKKPKRDQ